MTKDRAIELATEYLGAAAAPLEFVHTWFENERATWMIEFRDRNSGRSRIICVNSVTGRCIEMDILQD